MRTWINWKVFFILWIAAILATVAVLPYSLAMQSSALTGANLPMPLPVIVTIQVAQSAILFAIAIFGGLFFAGRVGLGHLPATSVVVPLTPLVITRAVVLNGLLGIAFGWLYWKRGLEAAIISHFSADIVLHVLLAL